MSDGWYYARDGRSYGPYDRSHLQQLAGSGKLRSTDLFWKEGMDGWKTADAIKGLFPARRGGRRSWSGSSRGSRRASPFRAFLIGSGSGLLLGVTIGVLATWPRPHGSDGPEETPSAEVVAAEPDGVEAPAPGAAPVKATPTGRNAEK